MLLEELPGGLKLMQQRLELDRLDLELIVPHDVDAVMDMYINAGTFNLLHSACLFSSFPNQRHELPTTGLPQLPAAVTVCSQPGSCRGIQLRRHNRSIDASAMTVHALQENS